LRKEIVVNAGLREMRAAVLEEQRLVELYIEREESERIAGNIYKGRVANVLPGMQAAFVDIGLERNAFLYVDDALDYRNVARDLDEPLEKIKLRNIKDLLKPGQQIVVQVTKEAMGTKGARVVTHASLPGRYLVLMPTVDYVGISRRITNEEERNRLKNISRRIRQKDMGLIVRTVAEGRDEAELAADYQFLVDVWKSIQEKAKRVSAPALLYKDHDLMYRLVRDLCTADVDRFIIDSEPAYKLALDLLGTLAPALKNRVYLYRSGPPIFDAYQIEEQIVQALQRKVWLPSGGYLIIDRTEALTSIDVNTGRYVGSTNLADTVLRTNLEAAAEIARQIRLRDIGGIIILDFIDMDTKEDEQKVLDRLFEEIRPDKSKVNVVGFTGLGLVEMTRKKVRQELGELLHTDCPYCVGTGRVRSEVTIANQIQRDLKRILDADPQIAAVMVEAHPSVAGYLIGPNGTLLKRWEEAVGKVIYVRGQEHFHLEQVNFVTAASESELAAKALPVKEGQVLELDVEDAHNGNPRDGISRLEGFVVDIEGAGQKIGQRLKVEITKVFRTYAKGRMVQNPPPTTATTANTANANNTKKAVRSRRSTRRSQTAQASLSSAPAK